MDRMRRRRVFKPDEDGVPTINADLLEDATSGVCRHVNYTIYFITVRASRQNRECLLNPGDTICYVLCKGVNGKHAFTYVKDCHGKFWLADATNIKKIWEEPLT